MQKRIVVLGGVGFIGTHLCLRLLEEGHEVFCVDIRDAVEISHGAIPGALVMKTEEIETSDAIDRSKKTIICCSRGRFSVAAAEELQEKGWDAVSLEGGYIAWLMDVMSAPEEQDKAADVEKSLRKKFKKSIWSKFTKAINTYELVKPGDKIAVCGRNSAHWAVTFLATITYGAVIVPILHEFKADNVHNIVNHSEAKLLFVGDQVWENLNEEAMPQLLGVILMTEFIPVVCRDRKLMEAFEHRNTLYGQRYPKNFRPEHICYRKDEPEELAVINYTSGTTGYSKGVMLPYRSLWSNVDYCHEMLPVKPGDNMVSMLPMGHVFL